MHTCIHVCVHCIVYIYIPFTNEMGCLLREETSEWQTGGLDHVLHQPALGPKIISQRHTLHIIEQQQ